tara:strand:- start:61 stop:579 length:519 start_codon:yes stop_codon:yes gene_type:complete
MEDPGPAVDGSVRAEQLQEDPRVQIPPTERGYHLFFLRFDGSKSRIVRVSRSASGPVTYMDLLQALRSGPGDQETGLLTAVDRTIKIHSVEEEDGVITVDLGGGIHRMGASIIRDRVHQICFTLFQFSNIKAVRILVDGAKPDYLGTGAERLKLPEYLGYPDRKIQIYGSSS